MRISRRAHTDEGRRRRRLPTAFIAATAAVALVAAGCSSDDDSDSTDSASSTASDSGWSYENAAGGTIDLPAMPEKIITDAPTAAALIPLGIKPVGIFTGEPLSSSVELAGIDISGIEQAGDSYDGPNLETVARLDPDLVITGYYPADKSYGNISPENPDTLKSLQALAPVLGVLNTQPASAMIADFEKLAKALGADVDSGTVADNREAFEKATEDFKTAVAAKPDLQVVALSPDVDNVYVANPPAFPELIDFQSWGLKVYTPPNTDVSEYYSTISWENLNTIPAGLVYYDNRYAEANAETLGAGYAVWERYPAVAAGHTVGWKTQTFNDYTNYTKYLTELTTAINAT